MVAKAVWSLATKIASGRERAGFLGLPGGNVTAEMQVVMSIAAKVIGLLKTRFRLIDLAHWLKQHGRDVRERTATLCNRG